MTSDSFSSTKAVPSSDTPNYDQDCPHCTEHMLLITWLITLSSKFRHYSSH